jgi:hypothetical protein
LTDTLAGHLTPDELQQLHERARKSLEERGAADIGAHPVLVEGIDLLITDRADARAYLRLLLETLFDNAPDDDIVKIHRIASTEIRQDFGPTPEEDYTTDDFLYYVLRATVIHLSSRARKAEHLPSDEVVTA